MADLASKLRHQLPRLELAGDERLERAKALLAELEAPAPEAPSMSNAKAELLAAAELAGVQADESMTKAEILDAMEGN
jgi:hypothetical protein